METTVFIVMSLMWNGSERQSAKRGTTRKKGSKELIFTKLGQLICIISVLFSELRTTHFYHVYNYAGKILKI